MKVENNKSLKPYNTFGIDVNASHFISITNEDDLREVLKKSYAEDLFIIGGGSNMLLTKDIDATVIHINLKGISVVSETHSDVVVEAKAGENWHEFVLWALSNDFGGLENLSLIPGNVGTSPIQNIGAYGVELKDVFVSCEAIHIQTLESKTFNKADCQFGYRDSIFKQEAKGQYIITSVKLKLSKAPHELKTTYGIIEKTLEEHEVKNPSINDISQAVIAIRSSKLPDPKQLGNSGSFFKNPIISKAKFEKLNSNFPEVPSYPINNALVKVPAGWLIDQCGLKGYRKNDVGVHKKQALVLVNYGKASGKEILNLAHFVIKKVEDKFGITLVPEVNIIT